MPGPGIELIGTEEIAEVLEVLNSRYLSRYGPSDDPSFTAKVHHVEQEMAKLAGVRYALGLSGGGSAALWIALLGLGVGSGDEVIVPGFTYVASISSIVYAGATPVLAEVDETFDLDPADVEAKITPRTAAILVVHMLGAPARLTELKAIADKHGIPLIEDCAQAAGASYQGQGVGGIGKIGTFSFNEFKTITCGDGGLLVTDDQDSLRALPSRCTTRATRPTGSSRGTRRARSSGSGICVGADAWCVVPAANVWNEDALGLRVGLTPGVWEDAPRHSYPKLSTHKHIH